MTIRFISFFSVLLGVLLGAHWLVYYSLVKFFSIIDFRVKLWLAGGLFLMAVSFFLSSVLLHLADNFLTRAYYLFSGFWVGLLMNLLMALLVVAILRQPGVKSVYVSLIFLGLALIYSLYGVWNARTPDIRSILVEIKNLPAEWKGKKIAQLSDLHLGAVNRIGFLENIVEKTNALEPDIIVITGDLFDGMGSGSGLDIFVPGLNKLSAKNGVYFITGNHENYLGVENAFAVLRKTKIQIIDDKVVDLGGLQIIGIGYPEFGQVKDVRKILAEQNYSKDKPSILLYHTPTNVGAAGASQTQTYWRPDTNFDFAKKEGIDLQLSGHSHRGQFIPFRFVADLIYGRYNYDLSKEGDFNLYVTSGAGTWGPPLRTGTDSEIVEIVLK